MGKAVMSERERLCAWVCSMTWSSVSGWQNRPDYFKTNDLVLLGDLSYIACAFPDALSAAVPESEAPGDVYDLTVGWQWGKYHALFDALKSYDTDPTTPPLMCEFEKYSKENRSSSADSLSEFLPVDLDHISDEDGRHPDRRSRE